MCIPMVSGKNGAAGRVAALVVSLAVLISAIPACATVLTLHYEFSEPVVTDVGAFQRIDMAGVRNFGAPGEPVLPQARASILLPPGELIAGIEIIPGERVTFPGRQLVEPGQRQYPLSFSGPVVVDEPDASIYGADDSFPGRLHDEPRVGLFRGYRIASFALHPVEYRPASGELSWLRSCEVRITTAASGDALTETRRRIRHDAATQSRLVGLVDNPDDARGYDWVSKEAPSGRDLDPLADYRYIIITTETWADQIVEFADFETRRGLKAGIFLRDWIATNYTDGVDEQACIRDFIIDAYETWDVDYVLLVGDASSTQGIPHRGLFAEAYGTTDANIPADLYYGCLDGSWNDDGDGFWGEPAEADLYHEIGVGRACVSTPTDLQNWMTKQIRYQGEPVLADSDEAIMVGELLWDEPTWGGDYKDEVKDGSSAHGYTTVGFPPTMNVDTLYDRDGTWSSTTLIDMMSNGLNIVNHLGHCSSTYMMKFYTGNISQFTNDGINHSYNFVYSQGCYPGAFDGNCIGEAFNCYNNGAVALIINSRYGWGAHGSTDGSSQYLDRQFFDAMFGEGIYPLADANDDSKMDNVWAIDQGAIRWCVYELNLFGDPAMHLWTAEPGLLVVEHPGGMVIGQSDIQVNVASQGWPLAGARVTICDADFDGYSSGLTDATGSVVLNVEATEVANLTVTVTAHDQQTYEGVIVVVPTDGAYLLLDSYIIDDDNSGGSSGNGAGSASAGETIEFVVTVENIGNEVAPGVTGILSCNDAYVTLIDDTEEFGDVAPNSQATCFEDFDFSIAADCPDGHYATFTLDLSSGQMGWSTEFSLPIVSAQLEFLACQVHDAGGDGCIDVGELISLTVDIENLGGEPAYDVSATLGSSDPWVVLGNDAAGTSAVPAGGSATLLPDFEFTLQPGCPDYHALVFDLHLENDWGYVSDTSFSVLAIFNWTEATEDPLDDVGHGQGIAWGDWDGDGLEDIYLSNSGDGNHLFGNLGDGGFSDLTMPPMDDSGLCRGVAWADMDNDGDLDLYLSRTGGESNRLFRNDGGGFTDISTGPEGDSGYCLESSWGDYDGDGLVDLYIANAYMADRLLHNDGDGVFSDVTAAPLGDVGYGRSISWVDYDGDGDLDIYLLRPNSSKLYRNEGDGSFVNVLGSPLVDSGDSWGAAWGDFDNDGDPDVYIANSGPNKLLRNEGGGVYVDVTSGPLGDDGNCRGIAWADYDNDGLLDLYLANEGGNRLLHNDGGGVFVDATRFPLGEDGVGSGAAWADYDNDGDLDLYLANSDGANHLYRNDIANGNHWLQLDLVGETSNRSALGALVLVWAGELVQSRQVGADAGFLSRNSLTVEFGLGQALAVDSLHILWPSGIAQTLYGLDADQRLTVEEEDGLTATPDAIPVVFRLEVNYPNPFNPSTEIRFTLPETAAVRLEIFDPSGRRVRNLLGGSVYPAGFHGVTWDGRGDSGRQAASGIYFCRIVAGSFTETRKMMLAK